MCKRNYLIITYGTYIFSNAFVIFTNIAYICKYLLTNFTFAIPNSITSRIKSIGYYTVCTNNAAATATFCFQFYFSRFLYMFW